MVDKQKEKKNEGKKTVTVEILQGSFEVDGKLIGEGEACQMPEDSAEAFAAMGRVEIKK